MNPELALGVALAHQQDLLDAAARHGRHHLPQPSSTGPILVRLASDDDRHSLEWLAALDSAEPPSCATLIGELLDRPVAALSLCDGRVLADPFTATDEIVAILRLRARQLGARRPRGFMRRLFGRRPGWLRMTR